jgi:hypothetical protein
MPKPSVFKKILNFIAEQSTFNTANVLIFTTSAGWLASSLAQIAGIYRNKNYSKQEKSFMIPQEFADACVNIGSFLLVTKSLKSITSKMVQTGKLAPKSIVNFLSSKGLEAERGKFDFNVTEVEGFHKHRQTFNNFMTMAESTAAIVGGVLSSNIITPILRNKIASKRKDRVINMLPQDDTTMVIKPTNVSIPTSKPTTLYPPTQRHTFNDFKTTSMRV